jgi:hypothetical protein
VHANGFKKKKGVRPSTTITERRGTYSTKQGFPTELLPSPTLLRIPNIVHMEFELKQVIGDTFHSSYALIDPLPIIYMRLVRALVPARRPRRIVCRGSDECSPALDSLAVSMTIRDSCRVAVCSRTNLCSTTQVLGMLTSTQTVVSSTKK